MVKAQLSDLFVDGENFKFGPVDYSSPETAVEISELMKRQDALMRSLDINLNELRRVTFDI